MKVKTVAMLAGLSAPLILCGPTSGGFLGIDTCIKPNPSGLLTVNVYAAFDRPGEDMIQTLSGTANALMLIQVHGGGTFYNHPLGTDRPPLAGIVAAFPSLAFDSFVTIGVKQVGPPPDGQPADNMLITPGFPSVSGSQLSTTTSGWGILPNEPAADPFNPAYVQGDGRVLLGQFSTANGTAISGTMLIQFVSNGVVEQAVVSFLNGGAIGCRACRLSEDCFDVDPCDGEAVCDGSLCQPSPPNPDCNKNGALDSCDIADGTSPDANGNGVPDECDIPCPADVDGDGNVGINDFLDVLAAWGPNPGHPADIDGDDVVGINDFLAVLAAWGPCP